MAPDPRARPRPAAATRTWILNPVMQNLLTPRWMIVKAALFVVLAVAAAGILVVQQPTWTTAACAGLLAWSASRAYYFAFYVIGRYIDPSFRFAGLASAAVWLWRRRSGPGGRPPAGTP
jgi:hypothetical protein